MKIEKAHNGLKWLRVFLKNIILAQCFSNLSPRVPQSQYITRTRTTGYKKK